jgi:nucleoside-diphosphate-sugar epimerase
VDLAAKRVMITPFTEAVDAGASEVVIWGTGNATRELCGFEGRLVFDRTKPDGQPRRSLAVNRARDRFGFHATTDFHSGLKRTIDWYRACTSASSTVPTGQTRPRPVSS